MTVVTVIGDVATTTTLALAAGWPDGRVTVLEADPNGGSMAAWLDIAVAPSLTDLVAAGADAHGPAAAVHGRLTPAGLRVIPAPLRAAEAARAVEAAEGPMAGLARAAGRAREPWTLVVDAGRPHPGQRPPAALRHADAIVLGHMQRPESPRASAARVERLVEMCEWIGDVVPRVRLVVAVAGDAPFTVDEIGSHLALEAGATVVGLPIDRLSAAVLAGRAGVSPRRLARLPLMRATERVAAHLATAIAHVSSGASA